MVRNPAVFLLDEPLSNLDAKLRTSMRTEIIKLHKKLATTFIYVTHDQTEAMTMGDRIVVMKDGLIQQVDTPQNLYDYPCNIFVAGFIGSPQMNFLDGTLGKKGNQYTVDLAGTTIPLPTAKTADGKLDAYVGKTLKVGIRPEDIKDDEEFLAKHPDSHLDTEVEVSELMGCRDLPLPDLQGPEPDGPCGPHFQVPPRRQGCGCDGYQQDPICSIPRRSRPCSTDSRPDSTKRLRCGGAAFLTLHTGGISCTLRITCTPPVWHCGSRPIPCRPRCSGWWT